MEQSGIDATDKQPLGKSPHFGHEEEELKEEDDDGHEEYKEGDYRTGGNSLGRFESVDHLKKFLPAGFQSTTMAVPED